MGIPALGIEAGGAETLAQLLERAGSDYERWSEKVARTGHCAKPVRLAGRVDAIDGVTGEVRQTYATENEPDGVLLIACGDRRESRCPSCAARYRGDAFQLVAAGLKGGKGVPETIADHPMLFVTFTAPSFGSVHASRSSGSVVHACRPRRAGKCKHGIPLACWQRHELDDDRLGRPLCPTCFDYEGQVLWNALAPELWRRTTIYVRRSLAQVMGLTLKELERIVRLSYVKVAEYQRRGAVHFHAVLRLDGVCDEPEHFPLPPGDFSVEILEEAVRAATRRVFAPLPQQEDRPKSVVARWGEQLEVRAIEGAGSALSPKAVAAYVAKYATKSSDNLGLRETGGLRAQAETDRHLVLLVSAAQRLAERMELRKLRLDDCAYALGFKGHWSTKSRRYSTTFTRLRHARREHVRRVRSSGRTPLAVSDREETGGGFDKRAQWRYVGSGYHNHGEAYLALCSAIRAREHRRLAKDQEQQERILRRWTE